MNKSIYLASSNFAANRRISPASAILLLLFCLAQFHHHGAEENLDAACGRIDRHGCDLRLFSDVVVLRAFYEPQDCVSAQIVAQPV